MPIKRFNLGLFVALTFIGGVFACGEEETTPDSNTQVNAPDPFTLGAYGVGQVTFEDDNALEYTSELDGVQRTLRLVAWYPTDDTRGESPLFQREDVFLDAGVSMAEVTYLS